MTDILSSQTSICRLDYLAGTLATAYRGSLASLVAGDFCMAERDGAVQFTGSILSLPAGDYEATLMQSGIQLARTALQKGHFELSSESGRIAAARELQIDITQAGRHIGTFLLKKTESGGIFASAAELSEELAGADLSRLTTPLRGKAGLLQKAEEIVAQIHSTKKNWAVFSDKLWGLSIDMFWNLPGAFYGAFDLFTRFLLLAAERSSGEETPKPLANFLDLLSLPLAREEDALRLRSAADTWTSALSRSRLELSREARRAVDVLRELLRKYPAADILTAVRRLLDSLGGTISSRPFLDQQTVLALAALLPEHDAGILIRFGEQGRERILRQLDDARIRLDAGDAEGSLDAAAGIDLDVLDDRKTAEALLDVMESNLSGGTADAFVPVAYFLISPSSGLSDGAMQSIQSSLPRIFDRLAGLGRPDLCSSLLQRIGAAGPPMTERLMLDRKIARSLLASGRAQLSGLYESELRKIVIPAARVQGISPDSWAEIVNPLHLERLEKFTDLLSAGDMPGEGVLIHVIANCAAGGVLIPDDRLFQRRVSAYLNSPAMSGRFLLNYLLLERLPVYFNDVGATSRIREYSTEIDSWGNDPVIYFIRKQIHVNASSNNVHLLEAVLTAWFRNDRSALRDAVPDDIYEHANPALIERYSAPVGRFFTRAGVADAAGPHLRKLLTIRDEAIEAALQTEPDAEARRKVMLLCKLYKEIVRKYALLSRDETAGDVRDRLLETVAALRRLRGTVLSPERTEPRESLYFKRHIAFGIPSVLGTYHEPKFDALSEMMRRAEEVPVLLEAIISEIEGKGNAGPGGRLRRWTDSLASAWEIMKLYGMQNILVDEFAAVLASGLSPAQIADVLRMWQRELAWMVSSISRDFHGPIAGIVRAFPREDLPQRLAALGPGEPDFADKAADVVMRDLLSSIPGLIESDRLLASLISVIRAGGRDGEGGAQERPPREQAFYDLHEVTREEAVRLAPELGSKAKNLIYLKARGLAIPSGVVLPARFTSDLRRTEQPGYLQVLREAVRTIERRTGAEFGGTGRPLFLSIRSGSYPSMPGILSSILYCGMNEQTLQALIRNTGDPDGGWDSFRRFIEHYGTAVFGLDPGFFEGLGSGNTAAAGGCQKETPPKMIVERYLGRLRARGFEIPTDVYEQLRQCVRAVYASWRGERADRFRSATGASIRWGTSVTLMEMISGNRQGAGASMFYTRDPATLEPAAYGETRECATGDDLASGRKAGRPLSRSQEGGSLEELDPELYRAHRDLAQTIEDVFGGLPQEVEVTYQHDPAGRPVLSVLQTRRMEQGETSSRRFDEVCRMESRVVGRGTGAGGGALSGVASFASSPDQIQAAKSRYGGTVILLRKTASTDDVSLMPAIGGMITGSGGVTSHAVVLAHTFGISAVVGCADMQVEADGQGHQYAMIGATRVEEGSPISIDGTTGLVFSGSCFAAAAETGSSRQ